MIAVTALEISAQKNIVSVVFNILFPIKKSKTLFQIPAKIKLNTLAIYFIVSFPATKLTATKKLFFVSFAKRRNCMSSRTQTFKIIPVTSSSGNLPSNTSNTIIWIKK